MAITVMDDGRVDPAGFRRLQFDFLAAPFTRGQTELISKYGGKILAGLEAARERHIGDAARRFAPQKFTGSFHAANRQMAHRRAVRQLPAIVAEMAAAQSALARHRLQRPRFLGAPGQLGEKQFHRAFGGGQKGVEAQVFFIQQGGQRHQQFIDQDFQPRQIFAVRPGRRRIANRFKTMNDLAIGAPRDFFIVAKLMRQPLQFRRRQQEPFRPAPRLVWPPHADIQNQPDQARGGDTRISYAMFLPRPRDGQITRLQCHAPPFQRER